MQVSDSTLAQLFNQIQRIGFFVWTIVYVLESANRGDANTNAIGTPFFNSGINHFQYQTRTIFDAATVLISTLVRRWRQELVQQVAVGRVQFNHIETRFARIGYRLTEVINDARNLFGFQRTRH